MSPLAPTSSPLPTLPTGEVEGLGKVINHPAHAISCSASHRGHQDENPRSNRMGRFLWIFGVFLLLATLAGAYWYQNQNGGLPSSAATTAPADSPLPQKIVCIGFVDREPGVIRMHPVQPGEVIEVVREGKEVKEYDLLLRIDPTRSKFHVERAKADLKNAEWQEVKAKLLPQQHEFKLQQQKAALEAAKRQHSAADEELKTKANLAKDNALKINIKPYEEKVEAMKELIKAEDAKLKELELFDAEIEIGRAASDVQAKKTQLQEAEWAVKKCDLRAPSAGTVLQVSVHAGETLGANATVPALIFCPKGPRIVRAEVIQEWASRVAVGQEAVIEDDTYHGARWKGRIKQVAEWYSQKSTIIREPFTMNDVRVLQCIVEVTDEEENQPLRIGQRVRVSIIPTQK